MEVSNRSVVGLAIKFIDSVYIFCPFIIRKFCSCLDILKQQWTAFIIFENEDDSNS